MILRALVILALSAAPALAQNRPAGVVVDAVVSEVFSETTPILGRIVAATRSVVAARTPGVVSRAPARVGDRVAQGDVLAAIETDRLDIDRATAEAALAMAQADFAAAEADRELAEQALNRISGLRDSSAFSTGAFEDRETEAARAGSRLSAAAARIESARAELARMEYDMTHALTRAPFDGVVIERHAEPGAYLPLGAPVATLLDVNDLEIEADVPAELIEALSPGLSVAARVGARDVAATLRAVVPEEVVSTRTRPARFTLSDGAQGAAAGQSVTLMLPTAPPRQALTVAKDALVQSARGWTVYVAQDGVAQPRQVEIGAPVGDRFEALSGLSEGDWTVVRGNERLRPGQEIDPRTQDGEQVAAAAAARG
jgi:RND family efflux transporter MFP subunit